MCVPEPPLPDPTLITRDYLLRQIHQLIKALERALFLRSNQAEVEARQTIDEALSGVPGPGSLLLPGLSREQVLEHCTSEDGLQPGYAVALADLLWHRTQLELDPDRQASMAHYARWLYEAAAGVPGVALPMDLAGRLADLEDFACPPEE